MMQTTSTHIRASAWAAIGAIVLVVVLTIVGELHAPLKNFLKDTFSHHWLGKSILSVVVYLVVALALSFKKAPIESAAFALRALGGVSIAGALLLTGFFIAHTLHLL